MRTTSKTLTSNPTIFDRALENGGVYARYHRLQFG